MSTNLTVIKKWVKALESGEYEQGQRTLAKQDNEGNTSFCCLGVLNAISDDPDSVSLYQMLNSDSQDGPHEGYQYPRLLLSDGDPDGFYLTDDLIGMNDNGESFKEIAKVLREKFNIE